LPYEVSEEMEGVWSLSGLSKIVVEGDLLKKGFRKNEKFSELCKNAED